MREEDLKDENSDQVETITLSRDLIEPLITDLKSSALAVAEASSAEGVHLMRVTLRKIRAWLGLCRPQLSEAQIIEAKTYIRRISAVSGPARDADVQLAKNFGLDSKHPKSAETKLKKQQQASYIKIISELKTERFNNFITLLYSLSAATSLNDSLSAERIKDRVTKLAKKSVKLGQELHASSADEDYHLVRKKLKKLRYTLGFLMLVNPDKELTKIEKSLKQIQEYLGDFQDQTVLAKELELKASELMQGEERVPQELFDLGISTGETRAYMHKMKVEFPKVFAKFSKSLLKQLKN